MSSCDGSTNDCSKGKSPSFLSQELTLGLSVGHAIIVVSCFLLCACAATWYYWYCKKTNKEDAGNRHERAGIGDIKTPSEDLEDMWHSPDMAPRPGAAPSFSIPGVDLYDVSETGVEMTEDRMISKNISIFAEESQSGRPSLPFNQSARGEVQDAQKFYWKGDSAYQIDCGGSLVFFTGTVTPSHAHTPTHVHSTRLSTEFSTASRLSGVDVSKTRLSVAESVEFVYPCHQKRFLQGLHNSSIGLLRGEPEIKRDIAVDPQLTAADDAADVEP